MPALGNDNRPVSVATRRRAKPPKVKRKTANVYVPPASLAPKAARRAARKAPAKYTFTPGKANVYVPPRQLASKQARKTARFGQHAGGGDFESKAQTHARHLRELDKTLGKQNAALASAQAPVLKVIEQTTRPIHAISAQEVSDIKRGGVKELFTIHSPGSKAAKERRKSIKAGWQLKDKSLGTDVLAAAGWRPKSRLGKIARGVVGTGLDVGQDPLTLAGGGVGTLAERGAVRAGARRVVRDAGLKGTRAKITERGVAAATRPQRATTAGKLAEDATKTEKRAHARAQGGGAHAPTLPERARAHGAAGKADAGKGLKITFAGAEIPGVRRATAVGGRAAGKAARRVPGRETGRKVVRLVKPTVRPTVEVSQHEFRQFRGAARGARAHVTHGESRGHILARALTQVPKEHHEAFIDALERNKLSKLGKIDPAMAKLAHDTRSRLKFAYKEGRRAGAIKGKVGDTEWMRSADTRRLRSSIKGEAGVHERRIGQLEKHALREKGRQEVAETEALGRAQREAAVKTAQARGQASTQHAAQTGRAQRAAAVQTTQARGAAKVTALKQQHAGDIEFERAVGEAKASQAATKTTAELKQYQRDLAHASRSHTTAKTARRRAEAHLKRVLARPNARREHVASAYGKVNRATKREQDAHAALTAARKSVRGERQRIKGVAPKQADRLLEAIEQKGPVRPEPVQRIKAEPIERTPVERVAAHTPSSAEKAAREQAQALEARMGKLDPTSDAYARLSARAERLYDQIGQHQSAQLRGAKATSVRAEKAAGRHVSREQQLAESQAKLKATENIPTKSALETTDQWLTRLHTYAKTHGLTLIEQRAEKLMASKPADLAKGYFPRDFDDRLVKQLGLKPDEVGQAAYVTAGPGRKVARVTPGFKRADQRRLASVNAERIAAGQAPFSTQVPLVVMNHLKALAKTTSQGEYAKELARIGRPIRSADDLKPGEAVYRLGYQGGQFGLHPWTRDIPVSSRTGRAYAGKGGQFVALNQTLVKEMEGAAQRVAATNPVAKGFDKFTGKWKRLATASLAFHVRNAVGDINQSYLVTPGHELPRNLGQAFKATKRASEQARSLRPSASDATIKVAGKPMAVDEFLAGARRNGVLDAGYIGRELHDLAGEGVERARKIGKGGGKVGQRLDRWMTNRENLFRLSTYKGQLDKGLSEREAADIANEIHVDYGELSQAERTTLRRVFPFYTWTARTAPLMVKMLASRPGKFANLEKVREEFSRASGMTEDEVRQKMTTAVQRQLPVTVKIGKDPVALSWSAPATLLNELPTGVTPKALGEYMDELGRFGMGMVNPLIKAPFELRGNKNMVTKGDIERADQPLTAAPGWVKYLPEPLKKSLDVNTGFKDPKTGKTTMGWRGKADWGYDQLMLGWIGQGAALAGSGRAPASKAVTLAGIAGTRVDPLNKQLTERAAQQTLRDQKAKLDRRLGIMRQTGRGDADHPTAEYQRLRDQVNKLDRQLQGKPAKGASGGGGSGFAGFGGGGGGSSSSSGFAGF